MIKIDLLVLFERSAFVERRRSRGQSERVRPHLRVAAVLQAPAVFHLECALQGSRIHILHFRNLYSDFGVGTTWTSQSAPNWPLDFPRLSALPSGPAELVTSLARIPFFSPDLRKFKKWTEVSMYSRSATLDSNVVPVTSCMQSEQGRKERAICMYLPS